MNNQPLTRNAASPRQVQAADKEEKRRMGLADEEFRQLLEDKKFRNYVWGLMEKCDVHRSVFPPDGHGTRMAYNLGVQAVGQDIMKEVMRVNPSAYHQMVMDANRRSE